MSVRIGTFLAGRIHTWGFLLAKNSKKELEKMKRKRIEFNSELFRREFIRNAINSAKSINCEKYFAKVYEMTDKEVIKNMYGTAIWDDPPKGWTERDLIKYSRGYLSGRGLEASNLMQCFELIEKMLNRKTADPYQKSSLKQVVDLIFDVINNNEYIKKDLKIQKILNAVQKSAYSFYKIK